MVKAGAPDTSIIMAVNTEDHATRPNEEVPFVIGTPSGAVLPRFLFAKLQVIESGKVRCKCSARFGDDAEGHL
jgi:hypothetical protein